MVSEQDAAIIQIELNALVSKAHAATYCLIDLTHSGNGTVVAVNIGSRYFLATAKHVIPKDHDFNIVVRDSGVDGVHDFIAHHVHPTVDVGLLELAQKDVPRFHDTFVPANRIIVQRNQEAEYNVTVIGYPRELIAQGVQLPLSPSATVKVRECQALTFHGSALPLSEWPRSDTEATPVPGTDIFFGFNPEDTMDFLSAKTTGVVPTKVDLQAPQPAGISGGGIWRLRSSETGRVWQPAPILHAIQFGFRRSERRLHGAMIDAWLDVVDDNYPDLRSKIQSIRQRSESTTAT